MSELTITHEPREDLLIVRLEGVMRPLDAESFDDEIERIADFDPEVVVLDMAKLQFVGSAGIGALVRLEKTLRKQEARVRVANASPQLQDLFKQSRLDDIFPFFDTLDQATA